MLKIIQLLTLHFLFLSFYFLQLTCSGPGTLHVIDGNTNAELIGDDVFFEIIDPVELEYTYRIRPAKDFGAQFNESFYLENVPLVPVTPKNGCEPPINIDLVEGNVALIQRGDCSFKKKTLIAEEAGARAVIITDVSKSNEEYYIEMIDDDSVQETHIPAAFLLGTNGLMILKTLEKLERNYAIINLPVNLTFIPIHRMNQPPWLGW